MAIDLVGPLKPAKDLGLERTVKYMLLATPRPSTDHVCHSRSFFATHDATTPHSSKFRLIDDFVVLSTPSPAVEKLGLFRYTMEEFKLSDFWARKRQEFLVLTHEVDLHQLSLCGNSLQNRLEFKKTIPKTRKTAVQYQKPKTPQNAAS